MSFGVAAVVTVLLVLLVLYDSTQRQHTILRDFPIVGHFRYWLEAVGPELRQYIVTDNNEERPFSRDQRRWIISSCWTQFGAKTVAKADFFQLGL